LGGLDCDLGKSARPRGKGAVLAAPGRVGEIADWRDMDEMTGCYEIR